MYLNPADIDPRLCFIAMPFRSHLENVYDAVEQVVKDCGLVCMRADKVTSSVRISQNIQEGIKSARLVIADLTGNNPNVFYEVGMAHAWNKRVILLVQDESIVPFDLKEIRQLTYDPNDLASLKERLVPYIINGISTIPKPWDRRFCPRDWNDAYIKLTSLEAPASVHMDQLINIRLTARNNGPVAAQQGYFSVSFPDGIDDLKITSNVNRKIGQKGDSWSGGTTTLGYPIAEGFLDEEVWRSGKEYVINVSGYPRRKGLLWFYVNACTHGPELEYRKWDPEDFILDEDQRDENVYCGVIEVKERT